MNSGHTENTQTYRMITKRYFIFALDKCKCPNILKMNRSCDKITLGPAYCEFGYYEHPAIKKRFCSLEWILLIGINWLVVRGTQCITNRRVLVVRGTQCITNRRVLLVPSSSLDSSSASSPISSANALRRSSSSLISICNVQQEYFTSGMCRDAQCTRRRYKMFHGPITIRVFQKTFIR